MVAGHRGVAKSAATKAISAWHFQVGCQLPLYGAWEAIPYAGAPEIQDAEGLEVRC
jgi:hypothetical protein